MKTNGVVVRSAKEEQALQVAMDLPDFRRVALPECYQQARLALARCERLEEIQNIRTYAQKAAFIAKMIKSGELMELARRVDAQSWRQLGEVIKKLPESPKGAPKKGAKPNSREGTRRSVAEAAGITSNAQTKAVKIASIVQKTFDAVVEQPGSVTVGALVKIADAQAGGTKVHLLGNAALRRVSLKVFETLRDFVNHHDPEVIAALFGSDRDSVAHAAKMYCEWFNRFIKASRKDDAK